MNWVAVKNNEADTWYRFSTDGNIVTVETDNNSGIEPRSAKFTITSDIDSVSAIEITVQQGGSDGRGLTLSTESLSFESPAGEKELTVTGSEWSASADKDWVTVTPTSGTDGTIKVRVTANEVREARTATLTVSNAEAVKNVVIEQEASGAVMVGSDALEFDDMGGTQSVTVTGEDWTATINEFFGMVPDWLTITPDQGATDGTIEISVDINNTIASRNATITVDNGLGKKTITVTQTSMTVDPAALWYSYAAETKNVAVQSAPGWTVESSDQSWLRVTKNSDGKGFKAIATDNNGTEERKAIITVTGPSATWELYVTQASPTGVEFRNIHEIGFGGTTFGYDTGYFGIALYSGESMYEATHTGYVMNLDLVAPLPAYNGDYLDIAPGTYNLTNVPGQYTVLIDPTATFSILKYEQYPEFRIVSAIYPTGGTVVITGDHENYHMDFDLDLPGGYKFKATYDGAMPVARNGWVPPTHNDPFDAGTVTNTTMNIKFLGRNGQFPINVWDIDAYSSTVREENGTWVGDGYVFSTRLGSSMDGNAAYLPDYTYGVHDNNEFIGSALLGFDDWGYDEGTWMYKLEGGNIVYRMPIKRGTVKTTHSGNTYTFVVNGIDATGAPVKGTFTGTADL